MSKQGSNINPSKNSPIKKTQYQQLEQKGKQKPVNLDYIKIIQQKDQQIRKLQYKLQKLQKQKDQLLSTNANQPNPNNFYKQKLEQEIKQNDRAMSLFASLSTRILKLIQLFKVTADLSEDCSEVRGLIKLIGDGGGQSISRYESQKGDTFSDYQSIDVVEVQISKKMQDLELVCDIYHKSFTKLQKQNTSFQKNLKQLKTAYQQQSKSLQKELKQSRTIKQQLQLLLQKNQQQKKAILTSINTSIDPTKLKQLSQMSKEQLIENIKKYGYKINQLQMIKNQAVKENKKIKTQELEKYKKMLSQVKEVKEMSMMGKSGGVYG